MQCDDFLNQVMRAVKAGTSPWIEAKCHGQDFNITGVMNLGNEEGTIVVCIEPAWKSEKRWLAQLVQELQKPEYHPGQIRACPRCTVTQHLRWAWNISSQKVWIRCASCGIDGPQDTLPTLAMKAWETYQHPADAATKVAPVVCDEAIKARDGRWPAFQNMVAFCSAAEVEQRHKNNLAHYDAISSDIVLEDLQEGPRLDGRPGVECKFVLRWQTYKGWKVYMLHTGCYAQIPYFEAEASKCPKVG